MVNNKHDAVSYENDGYKRDISNGNALYDAYLKAKKGSEWKEEVQRFGMDYLLGLAKIQKELKEKTYEFKPTREFILNERGKKRLISGEHFEDRIVKHSLCDEVLTPLIEPYLIYDNCASRKGKGIAQTRKRLDAHLSKFYRENKSNDGYILLIDYSKYYDNIKHDVLLDLIKKYVSDETAIWLVEKILKKARIDVSYMTDEKVKDTENGIFNSLEYNPDKRLLTGLKYLNKHLNIGDQTAQIAGVSYPIPIDNYIKIVKGAKYYGRYMDDSYIIHKERKFLKELLNKITEIADKIGIHINKKKTRIVKLKHCWKFLQIRYRMTESGKITKKISKESLTRFRRKMKKLRKMLSFKSFTDWFKSWFTAHKKILSNRQRANLCLI